jgi:hypothetical protein
MIPDAPWTLQTRQPWIDKEVAPAELNDEQKAYLEAVQAEKAAAQAEEEEKKTGKDVSDEEFGD